MLQDVPCAAFLRVAGELDVGRRATGAALRDHVTGAAFALAALGGHAEFELDFIKAQTRTGMAGDFAVGDTAADANNHGRVWLGIDSIGVVIINANLSHLQSWAGLFSQPPYPASPAVGCLASSQHLAPKNGLRML